MSWIIIKQPHPLDAIWSLATDEWNDAEDDAVNFSKSPDCTSEGMSARERRVIDARQVLMALPARNLSDSLFKLMAARVEEDGGPASDCDVKAILNEASDVMDAAIHRGIKLLKDVPGLLEGVSL